jgi:hypothetical protein
VGVYAGKFVYEGFVLELFVFRKGEEFTILASVLGCVSVVNEVEVIS